MILSPMPGKVMKVHVSEGEEVQVGQVIVGVEAMKMEYELRSDIPGKVERIFCKEGTQVILGQELAIIGGQE